MAMVHGAEVIETIGESQGLRISHALHHLLHTTVDVTEMGIDMLDGLTIDHSLQTQHTVSRRVVRAKVDNEVVIVEQAVLGFHQLAILGEVPL